MSYLPIEIIKIINEYAIYINSLNFSSFIDNLNTIWKNNFPHIKRQILSYFNSQYCRKYYVIAQYGIGFDSLINICVNLSNNEKIYYFKIPYPFFKWNNHIQSDFFSYNEIVNIINNNNIGNIFKKYCLLIQHN